MKEFLKKNMFLIVGSFIFIILAVFLYFFLFCSKTFYTQVDNTGVEVRNDTTMKYQYTLQMYDEDGLSKKIKFKTSRILREGAYLRVKYYNISGVNIWEEVSFEEMPQKIRNVYKE